MAFLYAVLRRISWRFHSAELHSSIAGSEPPDLFMHLSNSGLSLISESAKALEMDSSAAANNVKRFFMVLSNFK